LREEVAFVIDLIERIAEQDEAAMAELYDRASQLVYSLCRRIVGDSDAAETAALDTFMQVWRTADSFDDSRGSVEAWLLTLARSRSLDQRRRISATREAPSDVEASDDRPEEAPPSLSAQRETDSIVHNALDRVSHQEREVIDFAYFEGMSHSQIADHLNTPVGTVKSRIRSGVGKLRQILHPLERGFGS